MIIKKKQNRLAILSLVASGFILFGTVVSASLSIGEYEVVGSSSVAVGIAGAVLGLTFGSLVLYAAIMLSSKPGHQRRWGLVVLVFSFLSLFTSWGGLGVGLILGTIAGVWAITQRPVAPLR